MIKRVKLGDLKLEHCSLHPNHKNLYNEYEDSKRKDSTNEYWPLLKKRLESGYLSGSMNMGYISIDKTGRVIDGKHRTVILKDMYDDDFELLVEVVGWLETCLSHFFSYFNFLGSGWKELLYENDFVIKEVSLKELSYNIDIRDLKYVTRKNINNSFLTLTFILKLLPYFLINKQTLAYPSSILLF